MEKGEEGCEKLADSDNNGCQFPEEKVEEMDNKTSFIMKGDEGCENNDYATLEIPTKIFHDMVQYDVQTVAHIDISSSNLSAKYWTPSEYQTT